MPSRVPLAFLQSALGIATLCGLDAAVKHVALGHDVAMVTLGRYVAGAIIAAGVWFAAGRPRLTRDMLGGHFLRGVLAATTAFLFFWGITRLPLAEAITISFIAPLLVPPMASLFLGEPMQRRFVLAGLVAFGGVLVTAQGAPDFSGDRLLALGAILGAALTYAGQLIVLRARSADGSVLIVLTGAIVPALLLSPFAIGKDMPDMATLGWFAAIGLLGNIGIQLIARAYAAVEAQALAVLEFTALPWAALFGWLVFDEAVRPQVWAGAAIIVGASVWASRSERLAPPEITGV